MRLRDGQRRLGMPDAPRRELASRAWMAFAEEAVVTWPESDDAARAELCAFIEASFVSLLGLLDRPRALA